MNRDYKQKLHTFRYPYIKYTNNSKTYTFPALYNNFDALTGRNMSDPNYALADAIKSLENLCLLAMKKEDSYWNKDYDEEEGNLCFYANIMEFAKAHGYTDLSLEQILSIDEYKIEEEMRDQNFILLLVIGIPGSILSIAVIVVIKFKKEKTSFGKL